MFKVNPRASFEAVPSDGDESDDNISLTSTVSENDPDQEYAVENILAEGMFHGKMHYLIEWTGFPLHQCTWEPESNLGSELKAMWEEDKAKHASGELEPFDIQKFIDATEEAKKAKADRHRRRNKKRAKLGLPLTKPYPGQDSSDEEAVEEGGVEVAGPEVSQKAPAQDQQRTSKGTSSSRPATGPTTTANPHGSQPQNQVNRRPSAGRQEPQTDVSSSTAREQTAAQPQTTGYQGTARRPSKTNADALSGSRARPATFVATAAVGPSAQPSLAARKTFTAKKSTAQPTANIFIGGKKRKKRPNLGEVMADPTKEPKHFDRHRYLRKLELHGRSKEDMAPDPTQVVLRDLRSGQTIPRQNSGGSVLSPTQLSPQQEDPAPFESRPPQPAAAAPINPRSALVDPDAPPKKKRKSVRFEDDDQALFVQEPEQMDLESPGPRRLSRMRSPPPANQSPSLAQGQWTPPVPSFQDIDKKLTVGQSSVEVTFNNLPRGPVLQPAWLTDFVDKAALQFKHTCFAKAAGPKIGVLIEELLASGTIVSKEDGAALDRVAEYLTAGMLALYHGQTEYNVLIYPTKCEEWRSIFPTLAPPTQSEAALGYLIFTSPLDSTLLLPPLTPLSGSQPGLEDSKGKADGKGDKSMRELMMKRLFAFEYNKLLPVVSKSPIHNFFLAIPESRREIGEALFRWLRANNPACQIFTSHYAGGWDAFRARVEPPDGVPGAVIIHETLAWNMRRLPHLARYLIGRNDEYWCISEPVHGRPLFPSITACDDPVPPGEIRITRLFPYCTAIFLTPSFLVSEPRRALRFLQWFRQWEGKFHYRLVTAFNIHEYLSELADERYQARQELWDSPEVLEPETAANLRGLSREECRCRYVVAEMAAELHHARVAQAGPFAHDEENSQLVYADPSIDPNDEQSLVNWFGWWATLRADQFRKFHVIGSSETIKLGGSRRAECRIRIPKYTKVTINDPDAVLEVLQERNDQLESAEAHANGGDANMQMAAGGDHRVGFIQGPWAFRSDLSQREDSNLFAEYLSSLTALDGFRHQWMLYRYPVSWLDLSMAEHFGDFSAKFPRIHDWFSFTFPFGACFKDDGSGRPRPLPSFNTYAGFFYTIDKEGDPLPPPQPLERHPWIAVYRPINPHKKPYSRCELIIWDPAARTRYPNGQAPAEKDLIFMQRELIQYVREHGDEKNHGTYLDQVWFGGWDWPESCDSPYPIDVTLLFLKEMLSDIRKFLPAPQHIMETTPFKRVTLGSSTAFTDFTNQAATTTPAAAKPDSPLFVEQDRMDIDPLPTPTNPPARPATSDSLDDDEEYDKDARIIFHPPRGHTTSTIRRSSSSGPPAPYRSRCINRLYEEARLARARSAAASDAAPPPTHMWYRFVPTMDWYREQREEGRGFAHVNVEGWERVFGQLKIGSEGTGVGASRRAEEGHPSRRGSGVNVSGSEERYGRGSVGSG